MPLVNADKIEMGKRLEQLAATLNAREPSHQQLEGWFLALRECRISEVLGAMDYFLRYGDKMPTPGTMLKRIDAMRAEDVAAEHRRRVQEERETAKRLWVANPEMTDKLRRLVARMGALPVSDPMDRWRMIQVRVQSGEPVSICVQQMAAHALRMTLREFRGEAEPVVDVMAEAA